VPPLKNRQPFRSGSGAEAPRRMNPALQVLVPGELDALQVLKRTEGTAQASF
jgi:hypothetical protein